jgi:hypothetical protein
MSQMLDAASMHDCQHVVHCSVTRSRVQQVHHANTPPSSTQDIWRKDCIQGHHFPNTCTGIKPTVQVEAPAGCPASITGQPRQCTQLELRRGRDSRGKWHQVLRQVNHPPSMPPATIC